MVQTQAEAPARRKSPASSGMASRRSGYEIHHVFFFRRTGAFDQQPNTLFLRARAPAQSASLLRMFVSLLRHLRAVRPDAVVCFQHYGNVVGALAARLAGVKAVIINRNSARSLVPAWVRGLELALRPVPGCFTASW